MSTVLTESDEPRECTGQVAVLRFFGGEDRGMVFRFTTTEGQLELTADQVRNLSR